MSKFFINRPIVALVISIIMVIVGAATIATLPVAQVPNIVPPEVQVLATYVGADAHMRYSGGVTGYLEVLTNETNAFSAELAVVQARQNELLALVQLYEAHGGGWQR